MNIHPDEEVDELLSRAVYSAVSRQHFSGPSPRQRTPSLEQLAHDDLWAAGVAGYDPGAIERLIDAQYAECTTAPAVVPRAAAAAHSLDSLPPRPAPRAAEPTPKAQSNSPVVSRCVGTQCESERRRPMPLQHPLPADPDAALRVLAKFVRELELCRDGHSEPFKSALLHNI